MTPSKPPIVRPTRTLPFDQLPWDDFERLCLMLLPREGFENPQHYGAAGGERGRDIVAHRDGELWYVQCKRVKQCGPKVLLDEIVKIQGLMEGDPELRPAGLLFIAACGVHATARDRAGKRCKELDLACEVWGRTDLDARVQPHPDIVRTFFGFERLPSHVSSDDRLSPLLRSYAEEVRKSYVDYWARYVDQLSADARETEFLRPVGQAFSSAVLREQVETVVPDRRNAELTESQAESVKDEEHAASRLEDLEFTSLQSVFSALRKRVSGQGALLVAEPGAGKTLSLRHLAFECATSVEDPSTPVPIYVPLNSYGNQGDLKDFLISSLSSDKSLPYHCRLAESLDQLLERRPVLLLLDGLNEIPEVPQRASSLKMRFLSALSSFADRLKVSYIVATRETVLAERLDIPEIEIRPFDQSSVIDCLNLYAPEHARDIYGLIRENDAIRMLTSNPYRTKVLCQVYKPGIALPESAGALFEAVVQVSVEREAEQCATRGAPWEPFDSWSPIICELARSLTDLGMTAFAWEQLSQMKIDYGAIDYAKGAGLIHVRGNSVLFAHQQMQEYFAALWLKSNLESKDLGWTELGQVIARPAWDEPLYFLAGIVSASLLDGLITRIAEIDPVLACRCVGIDPQKVRAEVKEWLAEYIGKGLSLAVMKADKALATNLIAGLGMARTKESLQVLTKPTLLRGLALILGSDQAQAILYRVVAMIDTPKAVDFLIGQIQEATESWDRQVISTITLALARMRATEAHDFLVKSLCDIKYYHWAIKAVGDGHIREASPRIRELLGHGRFWDWSTEEDSFESLAHAVGKIGLIELVPDLMRHVEKSAAVETLLRLDEGQRIIDAYVERQRYLVMREEWKADARLFGIQTGSTATRLVDLWYWLDRHVGTKASDEFLELLLNSAGRASLYVERIEAIEALAVMRVMEALPLLRELQSAELPYSESDFFASGTNTLEYKDHLKALVDKAIEFLEEPRGRGSSKRVQDGFALVTRNLWKVLDGKEIPKTAKVILDRVYLEPEQFQRFAVLTLREISERVRDERVDANRLVEDLKKTEEYLADHNWAHLGKWLVQLLTATAEAETSQRRWSIWRQRRLALTIGSLIVRHGERGSSQRQEIIDLVSSSIRSTSRTLQLVAIRVLAELKASEYSDQLVEFLTDRTWCTAYLVVDALGLMNPPSTTCDKLASRLNSPLPDERYFAVLALGSIGRKQCLSNVLALGTDHKAEVRRAVVWALSQLNVVNRGVIRILSDSLDSSNNWLRLEAAKTVGELRIRELGPKLRDLLKDIDLRVVEQAAWALGRLEDRSSGAALVHALDNVLYRDEDFWNGLPHRVERRLKTTIAVSLGQIGAGVVEERIVEHLKREHMLRALVVGHLKRGVWKQPYVCASGLYNKQPDNGPSNRLLELESASDDELKRVARAAQNPLDRLRAVEILGNRMGGASDFHDWIPRSEPCPNVQVEAKKIRIRLGISGMSDRLSYIGNPQYDLAIARDLSVDRPETVNYIPMPASWDATAALWIAQAFPREYDLCKLIDSLVDSVESFRAESSEANLALCDLLSRRRLSRFTSAHWRSAPFPPLRSRYSRLQGTTYFKLSQRRIWSLVPELVDELDGERDQAIEAIQALCELGIHQAAEVVQSSLERLGPEENLDTALASVMSKIELSGAAIELLPDHFSKWIDQDHLLLAFYSLLNILSESDDPGVIRVWAKLQVRLFSSQFFGLDTSWLDRRLKRWGSYLLSLLIRELADSPAVQILEETCDLLLKCDNKAGTRDYVAQGTAGQIACAVRQCSEEQLLQWLSSGSWGLRLASLCTLISWQSEKLNERLEIFLSDDDPRILLALMNSAARERFPLFLDAMNLTISDPDLDKPDSQQERISLALENAILGHLVNPDVKLRIRMIAALGEGKMAQYAPSISAMVSCDDSQIRIAALQALRKMGDRSRGGAIAPVLSSVEPSVLVVAIEAVATLRYRPACNRLLELLQHPHFEVQNAAAGACGLLRIRRAIPLLEQRLSRLNELLDSAERWISRGPPGLETSSEEVLSAWELEEAISTIQCSLFLLGARPYLSIDYDLDIGFGEGFLTFSWLSLFSVVYRRSSYAVDSGEGSLVKELPYPLSLLEIENSKLVTHAIRKDLRATSWISRQAREAILASAALSYTVLESEEAIWNPIDSKSFLDHMAEALRVPVTGELVAVAWVNTITTLVAELERAIIEDWSKCKSKLSIDDVRMDLSKPIDLDFDEDQLSWPMLKRIIAETFDHTLGHKNVVASDLHSSITSLVEDIMIELGLVKGDPVRIIAEELDESPGPNDINDADLQFLESFQHIARRYLTCALAVRWGYVVLRVLWDLFNDYELAADAIKEWEHYLHLFSNYLGGLYEQTRESSDLTKKNPIAFLLSEN